MSSGFVSGGTVDQPLERDDEWRMAQQEIEERRRRKEEESRQGGEKSLYEILQNNKGDYQQFPIQVNLIQELFNYWHVRLFAPWLVAKEEAFQDSIKLKNQFRNLDEDEAEFLDSVLESTRAKEQAVKEQTSEQLELFRQQQQEADKGRLDESGDIANTAGSPTEEPTETQWAVNARKRKRLKDEKGLKGPKLRKSSSTSEAPQQKPATPKSTEFIAGNTNSKVADIAADVTSPERSLAGCKHEASSPTMDFSKDKPVVATSSSTMPGLGLVNYSSDEE